MKTTLTKKNDKSFNSELDEVFGLTKKNYETGTQLNEKIINMKSVDKVHSKCNCVDGGIVDDKLESILFSFSLIARPGYKVFKEPSSNLF